MHLQEESKRSDAVNSVSFGTKYRPVQSEEQLEELEVTKPKFCRTAERAHATLLQDTAHSEMNSIFLHLLLVSENVKAFLELQCVNSKS